MSSKSTRAFRACLPLSLTASIRGRIAQRQLSASVSYCESLRQHQPQEFNLVSNPARAVAQLPAASASVAAEPEAGLFHSSQDETKANRTSYRSTNAGRPSAALKSGGTGFESNIQSDRTLSQSCFAEASTGQHIAVDGLSTELNTHQKPAERYFPPRSEKRFVNRKLPGPDANSALVVWSPRAAENTWSFPPAARHVPLAPDGDPDFLPNSEEFSQDWVKLYKRLTFPKDGDLSRAQRELDPYRQAAVHFVGRRGRKALRDAWLRLGLSQRMRILPTVLIGSLVDSARKTLTLLSILPKLPREWKTRCECLLYLELVHWDEITRHPDLQGMFAYQIRHVSKVWALPEGIIPRPFLVLLLRHNSPEQCENIIDTVFQNNDTVPVPLILVMVDYFIKQGNPERATELLASIPGDQREAFKQSILDRLRNLIQLDSIDDSGAGRNFKILPRLMQMGMPLDANVHNRLLQQALSLRLSNVAWEVFRFMETENIHVDARSHLVLLRDSFDRQDREKLDKVLSSIHQREDLYRDPYLVAYTMHIVRIVCCFDRKLPPEVCFSHILAIYDRAYDRAPLVKLGLANALPAEQRSASPLPEPRPAALGFTIWAYVLCQSDEKPVSRLWHWIAHLIQHQDTSICEAARHDIFYNGFVSFFSRQPSTLRKGLEVVEEMIELGLCMPSQRTWSEVLCGFLRHGEEEAAEKVWRTMLARGVVPSGPEWSFLLRRYEKSRLARLVRYVLNERQMPEGLESALDFTAGDDVAAKETPHMLSTGSEYDAGEGLDVGTLGGSESLVGGRSPGHARRAGGVEGLTKLL